MDVLFDLPEDPLDLEGTFAIARESLMADIPEGLPTPESAGFVLRLHFRTEDRDIRATWAEGWRPDDDEFEHEG